MVRRCCGATKPPHTGKPAGTNPGILYSMVQSPQFQRQARWRQSTFRTIRLTPTEPIPKCRAWCGAKPSLCARGVRSSDPRRHHAPSPGEASLSHPRRRGQGGLSRLGGCPARAQARQSRRRVTATTTQTRRLKVGCRHSDTSLMSLQSCRFARNVTETSLNSQLSVCFADHHGAYRIATRNLP